MSKKTLLPQSRRHIWIYDEDWEYLGARFGEELGISNTLRSMIHIYVTNLKAQEAKAIDRGAQGAPQGARP